MRKMKNLLLAVAACLVAGSFSAPASAEVVLINGSSCVRSNDTTYFYYRCELGFMPYGTGYNAVIPMFYTSVNHTVSCQLNIRNQWGDLIAIPTPSGYRVWSDVVFPAGRRTSVTLFYQWGADQYAGSKGTFFCFEQRNRATPNPEFQISGVYTLRN